MAELYPNLMKLNDAKTRRSASDDMNTQFEVQKIRQQLESAVSVFFVSSRFFAFLFFRFPLYFVFFSFFLSFLSFFFFRS